MDPKLLTEGGLKAVLSKHKIKDNGLQKALAAYEKIEDDAHDECLAGIALIAKLAAALKKAKEVAANDAVANYLENLMDAADCEEKDVSKEKAAAEKMEAAAQKMEAAAQKMEAAAQKMGEANKKKSKDEDEDEGEEAEGEDEEEEGEYGDRLLTAFKKLKSMGGKPMKFVVCEARPFCGLMVAKRISPKHKEELTDLTGGSKKFLKIGECRFENGSYVFESEQSVPGLARRLQKTLKNHTGKKFKIAHGGETVEEDDESPEGEPSEAGDAAGPALAALARAPGVWSRTLDTVSTSIDQLKAAVLEDFGNEEPGLLNEVKGIISKFDGVLRNLDGGLADSLAKARAAQDPAARNAELKNSKRLLIEFIAHIKSDQLIAHIDANPFGVNTNLKQCLAEGLKHMAEAIGNPGTGA